MTKKAYFLIFLLSFFLFNCQSSNYQKLIEETVTEEYCTEVINNIVGLLKEGYVYLDFYKSPIKPKADESYSIEALDLVKELEDIPRKNRKFYDFIRDIQKIIRKTGDGHLSFVPEKSPGGIELGLFTFSLPFLFDVVDELDNEGNLKETYLIITEKEFIQEGENETDIKENSLLSEYAEYYNKKIKSINGENPFTFIYNLFKDYKFFHSPQADYIRTLSKLSDINIMLYPFLKEELSNINIIFENDEELAIDYFLHSMDDLEPPGLKEYYLKKIKFNIINNLPIQSLDSIQEEFIHQNDTNYKKRRRLDDIYWDFEDNEGIIKCKVDYENKKNVLYQNSFYPKDYNNFEDVMKQCLYAFYSNKYEIIVIQSQNTGGIHSLCSQMKQYLRPKIFDFLPGSQKDTDLNYESLLDKYLIYETCEPFDREKLYRGRSDDYGNGVIHNRTKDFNLYNIYDRNDYKKMVDYYYPQVILKNLLKLLFLKMDSVLVAKVFL